MKLTFKNIIFFGAMLVLGILYGAYTYNFLIIRAPFSVRTAVNNDDQATLTTIKKKVKLFFWHNDRWNKEDVDLIWSPNMQKTLQYLIDSWLTVLEQENIQEKRITLQSVAVDNKQAYISFDRNPFEKAMATFEKLLWIEGLLKTIRENNVDIQSVQLLVHHKVLNDYHLDFSNAWPIEGFF